MKLKETLQKVYGIEDFNEQFAKRFNKKTVPLLLNIRFPIDYTATPLGHDTG